MLLGRYVGRSSRPMGRILPQITSSSIRFKSSSQPPKNDDGKDEDSNSVPANANSINDIENFSPDLSSKVSRQTGSIPMIDSKLSDLMEKSQFHYDPANVKQETSYEFHVPPSPTELNKEKIIKKRNRSKLRIMLPSLLIGGGIIWLVYTYEFFKPDPHSDKDTELLRPDKFLPYAITFKHQIDNDHYLIELTRRNRGLSLTPYNKLFDGKKLWSIEIMQPDINIVRNYTPLPLYVAGVDPETREPHLRLVSKPEEEGKFIIVVKRYPDGEFSRWLTNLNLLNEVNVRGPHIEYKVPFHPLDKYEDRPQLAPLLSKIEPDPEYPENIPPPETFAFYGAGTGMLPLLQLLYSPNPPKGFIHAYISLKKESTLMAQFKTLNYFAEKCGRAKFTYLISEDGEKLTDKLVSKPTIPKFNGLMDMKVSDALYKQKLLAKKKKEVKAQISGRSVSDGPADDDYQIDPATRKPLLYNGSELIPKIEIKVKPKTALQQLSFFKKTEKLPDPSFSFVCGPESYLTYVSGKPNLNNLEGKDHAPIAGLLKDKGWTLNNIKRLQ